MDLINFEFNNLHGIQNEILHIVEDDVSRGITADKKRIYDNDFPGVLQIPGTFERHHHYEELMTFIYDRDSFNKRIEESLDMVTNPRKCLHMCQKLTFFTTQWDPTVIHTYEGFFNLALRLHVRIVFVVFIGNQKVAFEVTNHDNHW